MIFLLQLLTVIGSDNFAVDEAPCEDPRPLYTVTQAIRVLRNLFNEKSPRYIEIINNINYLDATPCSTQGKSTPYKDRARIAMKEFQDMFNMHYITFNSVITSPGCVRIVVDTVYQEDFESVIIIKQLFFIDSGRIREWSQIGEPHKNDIKPEICNSIDDIVILLDGIYTGDKHKLKNHVDKDFFKCAGSIVNLFPRFFLSIRPWIKNMEFFGLDIRCQGTDNKICHTKCKITRVHCCHRQMIEYRKLLLTRMSGKMKLMKMIMDVPFPPYDMQPDQKSTIEPSNIGKSLPTPKNNAFKLFERSQYDEADFIGIFSNKHATLENGCRNVPGLTTLTEKESQFLFTNSE